ncbi:MAG: SUMF1/EgtB/PvdO family nonheme iron enzyme [Kiritimatiellae bacterium]|nr:SUMF1/EgtB/PvdO family nonheme iron enzyme [Kiritimatiellia bacterium]
MKKLMIGGLVAVMAVFSVSGAVPSRNALKEAHEKVAEAIKDIRTEFENGEKEAVDVANRALELVEMAENPAQKYLLYKGAMMFFVRAKMYDRAAEIANEMAKAMGGVSDAEMLAFIEPALRKNRREAGVLLDLYRKYEGRAELNREAEDLRRNLKEQPGVSVYRRQLAEVLVLLGDWDAALKEFAAVPERVGAIAKAELDMKKGGAKVDALKHGDFWWKYPNRNPLGKITPFRLHAADFYREALSEASLSELKHKAIVRKLDEISDGEAVPVVTKKKTPASSDGRKAPIAFKIDGTEFNMLACTPGTFKFSLDFKKPERKITITRNYWMGATPVTYEQWWSVMTPDKSKRKPIYKGGEKAPVTMISREDIEKFCKELTRRNKRYLPSGYEFRLPTVAEWEWAGRSGREIPKIDYTKPYDPKTQDPYDVAFYFGPHQEGTYNNALKPIGLAMAPTFKLPTIYEIFPLNGYHRHTDWCTSMLTPFPVAKFKANKWGFYDMVGNAAELMADMLPDVKTSYPSKRVLWIGDLGQFHAIKGYQSALDQELKDPYFTCRDNLPPQRCSHFILRGMPNGEDFFKYPDGIKFPEGARKNCGATWIWFRRSHEPLGPICSFRLCIGPKLKPTYVD